MLNLKHLVLEVTEACPHACLHCYNYWRENRSAVSSTDSLTRPQIKDLITRVKSETTLQHVGISGGEPLLRPDLAGIVTDIMDEGLDVLVISNGVLLTPTRATQFPRDTVFELTLFSVDAARHDQIAGCAGAFDRTLVGASSLWSQGCRVAISVVVTRLNAQDVRDTLELGLALGGRTFVLNRINLARLTMPAARELVPTAAQLRQALDAAEDFAIKYDLVIPISVPIPPCVVDLRPYRRLLFGWCPRGKADEAYYTVGHNGLLRPCNHSSLVLGDLRKQSFTELVTGEGAAEFWRPVPSACLECSYPGHDLCRGGCPAASDECYGTRERWDPIIDVITDVSSNGAEVNRCDSAEARSPVLEADTVRKARPLDHCRS
jgi:radical SAM protein with 4Fe4S-binding SPASM domain